MRMQIICGIYVQGMLNIYITIWQRLMHIRLQKFLLDLSSYTQTTTPAEFKKMTLQELAQTMTSGNVI